MPQGVPLSPVVRGADQSQPRHSAGEIAHQVGGVVGTAVVYYHYLRLRICAGEVGADFLQNSGSLSSSL